MWACPECNRNFKQPHQVHPCNNKVLAGFFANKPAAVSELFWHFIETYEDIGPVCVQPTKSMIAIAAKKGIAYVISIGKTCINIVFPFAQPYQDNLCFHKIARVPGQQQFNHHYKMCSKEDLNEEVLKFMELAYTAASL